MSLVNISVQFGSVTRLLLYSPPTPISRSPTNALWTGGGSGPPVDGAVLATVCDEHDALGRAERRRELPYGLDAVDVLVGAMTARWRI